MSAPPSDTSSPVDVPSSSSAEATPTESSSDVPAETTPTSSSSSAAPPESTTSSTEEPPSSTTTPPESTKITSTTTISTTSSTPEPSSSSTPTPTSTSDEPSSTETSETSETSSQTPTSSSSPPPTTTDDPTTTPITTSSTIVRGSSTEIVVITSIATRPGNAATATSSSATGTPTLNTGNQNDSKGGLDQSSTIAVAVVIPVVGVALLIVAGLFFWRRRKQRMHAEEERRKEVEDYAYNPNDPTLPAVGGAGAYEMKEDGSSGYRGWGSTTLGGSTGRKASTTMSGAGAAYSDGNSPPLGNFSDTRSGEPLMSDGSRTPEGEILGAMGPNSADNRGNVHRGPSNASSSYSAAGRSDGSGENPGYGGPAYYDQYGSSNPYSDPYTDNPNNGQVHPVIRDNPARRNTRIENPAAYPQQSAGISQNF